jgi:hypothetical protein
MTLRKVGGGLQSHRPHLDPEAGGDTGPRKEGICVLPLLWGALAFVSSPHHVTHWLTLVPGEVTSALD